MIANTHHLRIGGPQGSGIDRVASILARACVTAGCEVLTRREYHSNIIGRHSYIDIAISDTPQQSVRSHCDLLICFDAETLLRHGTCLSTGGLVVYDQSGDSATVDGEPFLDAPLRQQLARQGIVSVADLLKQGAEHDLNVMPVALTSLVKQLAEISDTTPRLARRAAGVLIMAAAAARLGLPDKFLKTAVSDAFAGQDKVIRLNHNAIALGYQQLAAGDRPAVSCLPLAPRQDPRLLVNGTQAVALGKIAAGLAVQTYYPISPATDESSWLETIDRVSLRDGGCYRPRIVQLEDEIASINAAAGAALTGARAATSTSGPGFSLMSEGIGWAGMNEVPVVISHYQRGGPSTGMPTRTEQGDLLFAIHAGHGEFPRIVFASGDVESAFYDSMQAFDYAERYRLPVVHLLDKHLTATSQSLPVFDTGRIPIERGPVSHAPPTHERASPFAVGTEDIAVRPLVGRPGMQHWLTGVEHSPEGLVCEDPQNREAMMEQRMHKLEKILDELPGTEQLRYLGSDSAAMTVLCWGSVQGALLDARLRLAEQDIAINVVMLRLLWPFPARVLLQHLQADIPLVVIENSFGGQVDTLLRAHAGRGADHLLLKYSGRPFTGDALVDSLQLIAAGDGQPRMVLRDPYE